MNFILTCIGYVLVALISENLIYKYIKAVDKKQKKKIFDWEMQYLDKLIEKQEKIKENQELINSINPAKEEKKEEKEKKTVKKKTKEKKTNDELDNSDNFFD